MRTTSSFSDYQPLGRIGRVPIHITTIITALFGVGIVAYAVLGSARLQPVYLFGFHPATFAGGSFWTPLTYWLIEAPSFFSLLGMFCFYAWSIEVERYLGRARFLKLFALLVVLQPLIIGLWHVTGSSVAAKIGNYELTAAALIAFAVLYPNIEYFGWIPLKWFAFACFSIGSLMYFPGHDWVGLSILWAECGAAFGFIQFLKTGGSVEFGNLWEKINPFKRRPKLRVLPSPSARGREVEGVDEIESIDPLLDKIARTGIASLTAKERARLEKAREALLKKDRG